MCRPMQIFQCDVYQYNMQEAPPETRRRGTHSSTTNREDATRNVCKHVHKSWSNHISIIFTSFAMSCSPRFHKYVHAASVCKMMDHREQTQIESEEAFLSWTTGLWRMAAGRISISWPFGESDLAFIDGVTQVLAYSGPLSQGGGDDSARNLEVWQPFESG